MAATVATAAALSKAGVADAMGAWILPVLMISMALVIWAGLSWLEHVKRQRIARIARILEGEGFKVVEAPSPAEKIAWGAALDHLTGALALGPGASGLEWFAERPRGTSKVVIFEHEYAKRIGKMSQSYPHTVIAWPAGSVEIRDAELPQAEWFIMARHPSSIRRKVREREMKEPTLTDVARAWSLFGATATARRFLTPVAQAQLDHSPNGESWCVGTGWICASTPRLLDAENVQRFLAHSRTIVA